MFEPCSWPDVTATGQPDYCHSIYSALSVHRLLV